MNLTEKNWEKVERPFSETDAWQVIASDNGTSGTIEEILWNPDRNSILRRRWWPKSSVMGAGEVWFRYVG